MDDIKDGQRDLVVAVNRVETQLSELGRRLDRETSDLKEELRAQKAALESERQARATAIEAVAAPLKKRTEEQQTQIDRWVGAVKVLGVLAGGLLALAIWIVQMLITKAS